MCTDGTGIGIEVEPLSAYHSRDDLFLSRSAIQVRGTCMNALNISKDENEFSHVS